MIGRVRTVDLDPERRGYLEEWMELCRGLDMKMRERPVQYIADAPSFETYCEHRKNKTWGRYAKATWPGLDTIWTPAGERKNGDG